MAAAPKPVSVDSLPLQPRHAWVGGRPCHHPAAHPNTFQSINPSTALPLATIHTTIPDTLNAAIAAAQTALPVWSATPPLHRARVLLRAATLLRERTDALATLETLDTGKPFSETSAVDILTGADVLEYYAHQVASGALDGEAITLQREGGHLAAARTTKEPLGVCAALGAWNYPLQIALWKSGPCLAAGNTLVYKPSEFTSLHAQPLAEIYREAGLPDGVFNVVYGDGEVGAALVASPAVAKVSFTGQVSTGQKVAAAAAARLKKVTVELGGKSPLIVLPDADVAQAADGAMMANFYSSGQVCTNGTRVFVPRAGNMRAAFEQAVLDRMKHVRAGDPLDPRTNYGPLNNRAHLEKVAGYVRHGVEVDRARLLYGGAYDLDAATLQPEGVPEEMRRGFWIKPTVFTDCRDDMRIVREEVFGPVMCILYYDTVDEAVKRANSTELGLAAGVFGSDLGLANSVIARLEAGITWINTWGESPAEMAVGGWKQSGLGVENGKAGLEQWVRYKSTLAEMSGQVPTVFSKL